MVVSPSRSVRAVAVSASTLLLFGVVTGLIPNPIYVRMVPRTPLDYLFLVTTAGFLGAYTYQRPVERARTDERTATASVVTGFLAFGCPVCNVVLLALFGSSALLTYLEPLRPLLGGVSVLLFGGLLYYRSRRSCDRCADTSPSYPLTD